VCKRCGRVGHSMKECYSAKHIKGYVLKGRPHKQYDSDSSSSSDDDQQTNTCHRCGRVGHYAAKCYSAKHIKGYILKDQPHKQYDSDNSSDNDTDNDNPTNNSATKPVKKYCRYCKKFGHVIEECYTRRKYNGASTCSSSTETGSCITS